MNFQLSSQTTTLQHSGNQATDEYNKTKKLQEFCSALWLCSHNYRSVGSNGTSVIKGNLDLSAHSSLFMVDTLKIIDVTDSYNIKNLPDSSPHEYNHTR